MLNPVRCSVLFSRRVPQRWLTASTPSSFTREVSSEANALGSTTKVKDFADIPGPKGWPVLGTMLELVGSGAMTNSSLHLFFEKRFHQYGPIYKEKIGPYVAVFLHDPADVEDMFRREGKYPKRTEFKAWLMHREDAGFSKGVLLQQGEDWHRLRSALNPKLMRPVQVARYTTVFNEVVSELMRKLDHARLQDSSVGDLSTLLFNWSLESTCFLLFDRRLGCLASRPAAEVAEFIRAMQTVMSTTEKLIFTPPEMAKALSFPVWTEHCNAWDTVFRVSQKHTMSRLEEVKNQLSEGREVEGLIAYLLGNQQVSQDELLACLTDLMGGAVDTVRTSGDRLFLNATGQKSNTLLWALYLLARHPEKQVIAHREVASVLPPDGQITPDHIKRLPYIKALVKETLRMYPVAPMVSRVLPEEAVIRGYRLDAQTIVNVTMSTMRNRPELFPRPAEFKPERWLREKRLQNESEIHPFASLPFGFGPRSCIGRKVAELEMYLLLSRVLQEYRLESADTAEIQSEMRVLLAPAQTPGICFVPREH